MKKLKEGDLVVVTPTYHIHYFKNALARVVAIFDTMSLIEQLPDLSRTYAKFDEMKRAVVTFAGPCGVEAA